MVASIGRTKEDTMTNTRILNDADLDTVTGGSAPLTLNTTSNIVVPNIPRDKDLLTPQMIQKLISPGIIPQIPHY
jgi:hypothetical protein